MSGERGLSKLAGMVLVAILAVAGVAYAVGGGHRPAAKNAVAAEPVDGTRQAEAGPLALAKDDDDRPPAPAGAVCAAAGAARPLGDEIHESSGVAVSRAHRGIFWTHNDSGDPVLYAVDEQGRTAGRVRVAGASVEDWEDIALAPCPGGGNCLFVADIGDNDARRASITVYRVPEPAPGASETAPATAIRLRYPDGTHDAEAMFVLNGAIHVVTKGESGPIALYRAPANATDATLEQVRELSAGKVEREERITSADARADGRWIVLRTLAEARFYRAGELADGAAPAQRVDLRGLGEEQGEGIGFAPDGSVIVTSEGGKKDKPATFARLSCNLP
ncbi:MAG TPA: hypothetical protein VFS20_02000 [Longimicrobium sp.]|nr:hypothetical protein [Longimicrobium sp.]